jgi:hypothetical protein
MPVYCTDIMLTRIFDNLQTTLSKEEVAVPNTFDKFIRVKEVINAQYAIDKCINKNIKSKFRLGIKRYTKRNKLDKRCRAPSRWSSSINIW